jgi:imidazolonepropionase-like amidohydrolase
MIPLLNISESGGIWNAVITVNLKRDDSATVRGQVIDAGKRGVVVVRVFVGYESEAIITKDGGNFELPAHAAAGQTTLFAAVKPDTGLQGNTILRETSPSS